MVRWCKDILELCLWSKVGWEVIKRRLGEKWCHVGFRKASGPWLQLRVNAYFKALGTAKGRTLSDVENVGALSTAKGRLAIRGLRYD